MCGIAGYLCHDRSEQEAHALVRRMADSMRHRGPDYIGTHADGPVALGHARLSIIDLRPEANQPMLSDDGEVAVVFNGEIYNFQQLRAELTREGVAFRTRCDTEVLLQLYRRRGVDFIRRLRGMFAFAIWDRPRRRLLLARDRVGQKPLFFHDGPRGLSFASELQTLLLDPGIERRVDLEAMNLYLSLGFVPASQCIVAGVRKVAPGGWVMWEDGRLSEGRYWDLEYRPRRRPTPELVEELKETLTEAISMRMISDVPLGAFLSGGIDSSAVVGIMSRLSSKPVKTFSIGFDEADFSEVSHARKVARLYRTEHYEEIIRPDAAKLLPTLVRHYGEPFADPSSVPTYLLSQMTRRHVTVALSGDGGDEAFAGYTRYVHEKMARAFKRLPRSVSIPIARAIEHHLPFRGAGMIGEAGAAVRRQASRMQMTDTLRYRTQFGHFTTEQLEALYAPPLRKARMLEAQELFERILERSTAAEATDKLLDIDTHSYLPDDILVKVDIASMAHSLEVRSPFVDHEVVELAATLPPDLKLRGMRGKRILKLAMKEYLPGSIINRRKKGFGIPHARWLRGQLRDMTRDTLLSPGCRQRGYFEPGVVRTLLDEHDQGRVDHGLRIWNLLWLELWHREFVDQGAGG